MIMRVIDFLSNDQLRSTEGSTHQVSCSRNVLITCPTVSAESAALRVEPLLSSSTHKAQLLHRVSNAGTRRSGSHLSKDDSSATKRVTYSVCIRYDIPLLCEITVLRDATNTSSMDSLTQRTRRLEITSLLSNIMKEHKQKQAI